MPGYKKGLVKIAVSHSVGVRRLAMMQCKHFLNDCSQTLAEFINGSLNGVPSSHTGQVP